MCLLTLNGDLLRKTGIMGDSAQYKTFELKKEAIKYKWLLPNRATNNNNMHIKKREKRIKRESLHPLG